jgi:hypothetical protein
VTLDLSPHIASNVQVIFSSTISLSSSSNPKRNMEMERNMLSLLSLLKRNHKGLMRKLVCFKILMGTHDLRPLGSPPISLN